MVDSVEDWILKIRPILSWGSAFCISLLLSVVIFSFQSELEMDGRSVPIGTVLNDSAISFSPILIHIVISLVALVIRMQRKAGRSGR